MKLLLEQKQNLEKKLEELLQEEHNLIEEAKEKIQTITRINGDTGDANYPEYNSYKELLVLNKIARKRCEELLLTSQVVTHFNNNQIDIGTTFVVQLDGYPQEKFTMVESNDGISSLDGYITSSSILGQSMLGKKKNETIQGTLESGEEFEGKIVRIIPKKDLVSIRPHRQEKEAPQILTSSKETSFLEYYSSLISQREQGQQELERLDGITLNHIKFLKKYYEELKEKSSGYRNEYYAINRLNSIALALKKPIIKPKKATHPELGSSVILEFIKPNERERKEYELISNQYANELSQGLLSVRQPLGFFAYRAQLGESLVLSEKKTVRVAQFDIPKKGLLFPLSANYLFAGSMKIFNQKHKNYILENHPTMTLSQKRLFDHELEKVMASKYESEYSQYIYQVADLLEKGTIKVQDEIERESNQEQVGLGSRITGFGIKKGQFVERTHEVIDCAFTVETRDQYVEYYALQKDALLGKKAKDKVAIQGPNGKKEPFYIMEVSNKQTNTKSRQYIRK